MSWPADSDEALIDALAAARPAQTDVVGQALLAAVRGALTGEHELDRTLVRELLGAYEVGVGGEPVLVVPKRSMFAYVVGLVIAATAPSQVGASKTSQPGAGTVDAKTRAAIEAVAYDYVDGQLEGRGQGHLGDRLVDDHHHGLDGAAGAPGEVVDVEGDLLFRRRLGPLLRLVGCFGRVSHRCSPPGASPGGS